MLAKFHPELGKTYGQWTVVSMEVKRDNNRTRYFKVQCSCHRIAWRTAESLEHGISKACKSCCRTANNVYSFIRSYIGKAKRRAAVSRFEFNLTAEYLQEIYEGQGERCALSGLPLTFSPTYRHKTDQTASLDRIDNSKGYIQGNVQWTHKEVNFMKGKLAEDRLVELCRLVIATAEARTKVVENG